MKSIEEFLSNLHREKALGPVRSGLSTTNDLQVEMDSTLVSAVSHGWRIAPVLARSRYFSREALAGEPTRDFAQVYQWFKEYNPQERNWVVETGAKSGLLILEFNYEVGQQTLRYLCADDWSWSKTLQFTDLNSRFVCFQNSIRPTRIVERDFPGILIHWDNYVLIPPSVLSSGAQVTYLNPGARVLELPEWLLEIRPVVNKNASQVDGGFEAA